MSMQPVKDRQGTAQGASASPFVMETQCPFCSVQCKMRLTEFAPNALLAAGGNAPVLDYDEPVQYAVEAKPNKASEGRLCVKGMNAYQHAVSDDRIVYPMARRGDTFERISWEEANAMMAERLQAIAAQHGRDAIGLYGGGSLTNESAYLLGKFARVALRTRYIDYNGRFCMSAAASAGNKTFGIDRGLTNPLSDIPLAKCIILTGTNIAECQPTLTPYFTKAKENGAYIIVIDPRETGTSKMADLHLRVKPGMDAALANGMLRALIEEGLVDEKFVRARTKGYDALRAHIEAQSVEAIAELAGVPAESIRKAAIAFGKAETGMVFTARGVEQQTDGFMAVRNFLNLTLLTGKSASQAAVMAPSQGKAMAKAGASTARRPISCRDIA